MAVPFLPSPLPAARLLVLLLSLLAGLAGPPASAAEPAPVTQQVRSILDAFPGGLRPEQLDAMLAVMDDEQVRTTLRDQLLVELERRQAAAAATPPPIDFYGSRLRAVAAAYPTLPDALARAFASPRGTEPPLRPFRLVLNVAMAVLLGIGAMLLVRRLLEPQHARLTAGPVPTLGGRLGRLLIRLLLGLVEIAAFLAAILFWYTLIRTPSAVAPLILHEVLGAALLVLLASKLLRFACDPDAPQLRLLPLGDAAAHDLHRTLVRATLLVAVIGAFIRTLSIIGVGPEHRVALVLPISVVPSLYLIAAAWRRRTAIATAVADRLETGPEARATLASWPVLAAIYLGVLWLVTVDAALRGASDVGLKVLASILIAIFLPLLAWAAHAPLARLYGIGEAPGGTPPQAPAEEEPATLEALPADGPPVSAGTHVRRLMRAVWVVLLLAAVMLTALVWGFDPRAYGVGAFLFRLVGNVGAVLLLGYVGWALMERWVELRLEESRHDPDETRGQRLQTLLPLLRKFVQVVLVTVVVMIILASLGVNIGPLIAGAGVVGIAIGFGAQSTVANILTGVSFLMVDAFRIGDYIEMGNIRGKVEGITLTALRLRHHRGAVHTLPFSQIRSLTNYSRDWMMMRLLFRMPPETDLDLVRGIVKRIGKELLADPELGPYFIEPLKSQGVRAVEDSALVIGVKYTAKPIGAFMIRKKAYQRLLKEFQDAGIEFVGRGVVVKVEGADRLPPHVAGAAADAAIEAASQPA